LGLDREVRETVERELRGEDPSSTTDEAVRIGACGCHMKIAGPEECEPAVEALSGHMSDRQRKRFRDKLERYVRKPDRDLILAFHESEIVGFNCVIEQDEVPLELSPTMALRLETFACGNGLMVLSEFRRRGIGIALQLRAEQWARERRKPGFWLITHRQSAWYARHFGYVEIGRIVIRGVERRVMAKEL